MFEHLEEKEAVKIATLIEENGYLFYTHLAKRTDDKDLKAVLKKLAYEEKKHKRILENKYYPEAGFGETITDEEIDIEEYVEKTTDPKVFTLNIDMEKLVDAIDSPKKAILLAVQAERYASEYFEGMAGKASTEDGRRMYKELADEERHHIDMLETLIKTL